MTFDGGPADSRAPLLTMQGIRVTYGALRANDDVDFTLHDGEIHALLGENGAGKTTLMKALVGLAPLEAGRIALGGRELRPVTPVTARNAGIGMVHQHFMLIPSLTVAQNVCIGLRSEGYPFPRYRRVSARLEELSERYRLKVSPAARVADLSVGEQQRVEIIKTLYRGARLLILDEPTSVLIPREIDGLFEIIRTLSASGTAVVFISHKLGEVMTISRSITVLRGGRVVATRATRDTDPVELARLMVGHDLKELPAVTRPPADAPVVARCADVRYRDARGVEKLRGVDLAVRAGEIHGIAGVDGNGQIELARIFAGILSPHSGTLWLKDRDITRLGPRQRIHAGLAYVPADRQQTGLAMDLPVSDNLALKVSDTPPFASHGILNPRKIRELVDASIRGYDIRCTGPEQEVRTLSGGNQQKLVLARELRASPSLIVAMQPTHGLDVGATRDVHALLIDQKARGCAILLISTELDEILSLSTTISVMYEGVLVGTMSREEADRGRIGLLMAGRKE